MLTLWILALGSPLYRVFKLDPAPVPQPAHDLNNPSNAQLVATFEIGGLLLPVMIDTGATFSVIPRDGRIMRELQPQISHARMNVEMPFNKTGVVDERVILPVKPFYSTAKTQKVALYLQGESKFIFGYEAILGTNVITAFELQIVSREGKLFMTHQGITVGRYTDKLAYQSFIRINTSVEDTVADSDVKRIILRYKGVFTDISSEPLRGEPMRIFTTHGRPIYAKQRHYSPQETTEMKDHIRGLLDKGIIEPTESGYAATSRMIMKKSGAGRLVVNYIPLNRVTLRDSYVLPHISDILGVIQGNKYFTTMDCAQGFYQILVDRKDRHKTAFSTPIGNFQFVRCPFGARNSCAKFQAEMNRIFLDGLGTKCVVYVDDILVFGKTREEHNANLTWVLSRCEKYNVKLKIEKCAFAKTEVD